MTSSNNYTSTLYIHPDIIVHEIDNYKSIRSTSCIKQGNLLLLEHVFTGTMAECQLLIRENKYFYDELCPRDNNNNFSSTPKVRDIFSLMKSARNCVGTDSACVFLGDMFSKFNHDCDPNSVFFATHQHQTFGVTSTYVAIYSYKDIDKNQEITVHYGFNRGHCEQDDFSCKCERTTQQHMIHTDEIYHTIKNYQKLYKLQLLKMIKDYELKTVNIFTYHILLKMGAVIGIDQEMYCTQKFIDEINTSYTEGNLNEKIEKLIEFVNNTTISIQLQKN